MHKFARIVAPLHITVPGLSETFPTSLLPNTEVKNIKLSDGHYRFEARGGQTAHKWVVCYTSLDLPAFTDKGRAQRAASEAGQPTQGVVGRPKRKDVPGTKWVGSKVTAEEYAQVKLWAEAQGCEMSTYVRRQLGLEVRS